jgi:hypothetical protein
MTKLNLNNLEVGDMDGGFKKNHGPRKHVEKEFTERTINQVRSKSKKDQIKRDRKEKLLSKEATDEQ